MKERESTRRFVERTNRLLSEMRTEQFAFAARAGEWQPHVNVYRYPSHYEVVVELAGVESRDVAVTMPDDRQLVIKGTRRWPDLQCAETGTPCHRTTLLEIEDGAFAREISLREAVQRESIGVDYRDGLVWIRIPLKEARGG